MLHRWLLVLALLALPCPADEKKTEQEIRATLKTMNALMKEARELEAQGQLERALLSYGIAVRVFEQLDARLEGKSTGVLVGGRVVKGPVAPPPPVRPRVVQVRKSRWDPPGDLAHLETTPAEQCKRIDELVAVMLDPMAGRKSLEAKQKLAMIGKPAFPRILGAMAGMRDQITDRDTMQERLMESSLKLGDECLREMDGYLNAKEKGVLRPGTDKKYITYILRLHYKRWQQVLKDAAQMPGPAK